MGGRISRFAEAAGPCRLRRRGRVNRNRSHEVPVVDLQLDDDSISDDICTCLATERAVCISGEGVHSMSEKRDVQPCN